MMTCGGSSIFRAQHAPPVSRSPSSISQLRRHPGRAAGTRAAGARSPHSRLASVTEDGEEKTLYSTCKIANKACATPLIFVFYVWWPFVTWSWPWTELNIKHLLNQCLALYFRSTRSKYLPKTDNFEVSTARNLKAPILNFDLTLTWHVTSFGKFRECFRIVSSRAFERRIGRLFAAIRLRVMTWGRLTSPPQQVAGGEMPQQMPG